MGVRVLVFVGVRDFFGLRKALVPNLLDLTGVVADSAVAGSKGLSAVVAASP